MKIKIKLLTLVLSLGLFAVINSSAQAQGGPPPPPGGGHGSSGNQPPGGNGSLGGGSAILILLTGAYASGKIYHRKKSNLSFLQQE